ncbi:MAG: geranylgeranylglycerol-phosphate geranylgeranyltransferase [Candidatus Caldarchaeum sp.]|nr:geranylgeranylglycerol-phosphate geranylgeranyltransferase [Candidatus Caldarchaeum sp.]MDW8063044.1 geranylgeranylglycerol-phosphate geranylgeranyltransferase [Candidatus Caldarchaeum sp.]
MRAKSFLKLSRPPNGLLMFFAVLIGVLFSEKQNVTFETGFYAFVTAFGLTSSSMALNDYFDKEVDAVNNPSRPIPSGEISPRAALLFAVFTAFAGLFTAFQTSPECLAFASLTYLVSASYNIFLKKTGFFGNLAVSFTVVAPFLYGSLLSDASISQRIVVLALLAFLANTGREVIKGMTDVEGDALRQVNTIARKYGLGRAAQLGATLYLSAVVLSPLPYLLNIVGPYYLTAVAAADVGFVFSSIKILKNPSPQTARKQKNLTLVWMFLALLSFAVGGVA